MSDSRGSKPKSTNAAASKVAAAAAATTAVGKVDVKHKPMESAKELKTKFKNLEKGLMNTYARLAMTEKQIYDLERSYLEETRLYGNVLSGWDKYLEDKSTNARGGKATSKLKRHGEAAGEAGDDEGGPSAAKRPRTMAAEERLFSLGSVTSPASKEVIETLHNKKPSTGVRGRPRINRGPDAAATPPKSTGATAAAAASTPSSTKSGKEKKVSSKKEKESRSSGWGSGYKSPFSRKALLEKEAKSSKKKRK